MKIQITLFGKPKDKNILELVEMYKERISRYEKVEFLFLGEFSGIEKYFEKVGGVGKQIYILDEDGQEFSSQGFSEKVYEKNLNAGMKEIIFGIGPSEGWGNVDIKDSRYKTISLSKMAMQHDLAFLVLIEQLYRAISIKNNLPYHKV